MTSRLKAPLTARLVAGTAGAALLLAAAGCGAKADKAGAGQAQTGAVKEKVQIGTCPHFASPALSRGRAFVGTKEGVVAVASG